MAGTMKQDTKAEKPIQCALPIKELSKAKQTQIILSQEECRALGDTLDMHELSFFQCDIKLTPKPNQKFHLKGNITAKYKQLSALSLEPVDLVMKEDFTAEFHPLKTTKSSEEELDLEFEEDMIEPYEGEVLDVGQVIYEQFVIALEEFPKNEGEVFDWQDKSNLEEDHPFAKLSKLNPASKQPKDN